MFCMDSVYKAQKEALRIMPPEGFFDKNKTIINGFLSIWQKRLAILQVIRYNKSKVDEFLTNIIFLTI